MMIREPPKKAGTKELKVNIPVKYHLQLHSLKVLEGRQIHGVVEEALDRYFASMKMPAGQGLKTGVDRAPAADAR